MSRLFSGNSLVDDPGMVAAELRLLHLENILDVVGVSRSLASKLRPHLVLHLVPQSRHPALVFQLQVAPLVGQLRLDDLLRGGVASNLLEKNIKLLLPAALR